MKYPVLAALLLVPVLMFSQEPAVIPVSGVEQATFTLDGKTVTLSEYIMLLLEKNSDSLAASYALGMTDTDYQKFQKKYAFYLNGEASATKAKYPDVLASITTHRSKANILFFMIYSSKLRAAGRAIRPRQARLCRCWPSALPVPPR